MQKIFGIIRQILQAPDLRKKIFFTFFIIVIFRIFASIPAPGVNVSVLASVFKNNQALSVLNIFSGGTLSTAAIVGIGLGPFITATVIFQFLAYIVPKIKDLQEQGERGQRIINQYTRIITIPIAILQSYGIYLFLLNASQTPIIGKLSLLGIVTFILTMSAGSIFLMWLGEMITEYGIGDGISLLIALGILATLPEQVISTATTQGINGIVGIVLILLFLAMIVVIIIINESTRNVPVNYTRMARGVELVGGEKSYIPIKINTAGVMPIIFALSLLLLPTELSQILETNKNHLIHTVATSVFGFLSNQTYYGIIYALLIIFMTYFYTFIVFKPEDVSNNIQKQGGFIPGFRPGKQTENYIYDILLRLTFVGAIFLAVIAIIPLIVQGYTNITTVSIGGTSILIIVTVLLTVIKNIRSQMVTRSYSVYV
jgi:preprotein translocase subunit SecY